MDSNRQSQPAHPAAAELMRELLAELSSGDELRAEAASQALIKLGDEATTALSDLLAHPNVDARWWAVRTLAALPTPRPERLVPSLRDSDPTVRQCAALGLAQNPSEAATPHLVRALSDVDALTAELAGHALVAIGPSAVPSLLDALKNSAQAACIQALRALAEIGDHRAIPAMIAAAAEDSAMLHYWAEKGLDKLGVNMVYLKP